MDTVTKKDKIMKKLYGLILVLLGFTSYSQNIESIGDINGSAYLRLSDDSLQYNIVRSDRNGNIVWAKDIVSSSTSVFDTTLDLYMVYGYTTINGNKILSNPGDYDYWLVVKTKTIESVIYPNPTRNNVFVFVSDVANNLRITLYDSANRIILQQRLIDYTTNIKLPKLATGLYLYRIENDLTTIRTGKLCVN